MTAYAPVTIPTARSVDPIGPFTYCGRTGSVAPMLSSVSSVTAKSAAKVLRESIAGSEPRAAPGAHARAPSPAAPLA